MGWGTVRVPPVDRGVIRVKVQAPTVICQACDGSVTCGENVQSPSEDNPTELAKGHVSRMGGVDDAQDRRGVSDKKFDVLRCEGTGPY